ncbi:MAG TPA: fatty acid desaturase [Steroidobacteraceae bacterium]|nr:fatty acid desaturase [Steroidobacteraceae bacterium]
MDHALANAEGLDRATLRRLSLRSNARGFAQLAWHGLLIAATGALVWASRGRLWIAPALVLYGVALNFLFCALHESIHRTAFASRRVNDALAWITGALLVLPPEFFRAFHFAHHRFTQDPARDPELAQPPPATLSAYLWRASGLPNWKKRLTVTLRHAITGRVTEPFIAAGKRAAIVREARQLWVCYGAVLALSLAEHSSAALLYWIVPVVLGQPFLRLYLLSEHAGCAFSDDMFANTRTTYTLAAVRLLTWQMPYHVEHHAFPAVPFHRLAQVNALIRGRIQVEAAGYLALHAALIRALRPARPLRPSAPGRGN